MICRGLYTIQIGMLNTNWITSSEVQKSGNQSLRQNVVLIVIIVQKFMTNSYIVC